MFKSKQFLYGLGTGLIITAIVLQLATMSVRSDDPHSEEIEWQTVFLENIEHISETAEQHGYKLIAQQANDSNGDEHIAESPESELSDEAEDTEEKLELSDEETILNITAGLGSLEVAELLEQLNLIVDRKRFEEVLMERGLSKRIQIGTYRYTNMPDLDELIEDITK